MGARLTRLQRGALEQMAVRGHLTAGWGGYSMRTLRSLEDRGLARESTVDPRRFTTTERGDEVVRRGA